MKKSGKITLAIIALLLAVAATWTVVGQVKAAGGLGHPTNEETIPLSTTHGAAAPYAVLQRWGDGNQTGQVYDVAAAALAAAPTYGDCAVRFAAHATTGLWSATLPDALPSGGYLAIIRDGADGAEAATDTDVTMVYLEWDTVTNELRITKSDMFVGY